MKKNTLKKMNTNASNSMNRRPLASNQQSQMIVLLGVTLALSVFLISTIPSEIADLDLTIERNRSNSLLPEFLHLKDVVGKALQYSLVTIEFNQTNIFDPNMNFTGKEGHYTMQYNTVNYYYAAKVRIILQDIKLQEDKIFSISTPPGSALLFSHKTQEGTVYTLPLTLSLKDKYTTIYQTVNYDIICNEEKYL